MIRRRLATLAVGLVMLAAPSAVSAPSPGDLQRVHSPYALVAPDLACALLKPS